MTTKKMIHAFCIVLIARAKTNQDKTKQNIKCHYQQPLSNGERFCRAGLHANFFFFFLVVVSTPTVKCFPPMSIKPIHCLPPLPPAHSCCVVILRVIIICIDSIS